METGKRVTGAIPVSRKSWNSSPAAIPFQGRMKRQELAGLILTVHAALACSSGDGGSALPPPGCEAFSFERCNVLDEDCQRDVFGAVACLRDQDPGPLPEIRTISRADVQPLFEEMATEELAESPQDPDVTRAAELLGLVPPGGLEPAAISEAQATLVAGFFDTDSGAITLVAENARRDGAVGLLAHEFVHVLQDRRHDLSAVPPDDASTDTNLGASGLVEGEASLYSTLWEVSNLGRTPSDVAWPRLFANSTADADLFMQESESPLLDAFLSFPYTYGFRFVHATWETTGQEGIDARYADMPSTLEILHGRASMVSALPTPEPATGYELIGVDELGAQLTALFASKNRVGPSARELTSAWRADWLWIFGATDSDDTLVIWRILLDDFSAEALTEDVNDRASPTGASWMARLAPSPDLGLSAVIVVGSDPAAVSTAVSSFADSTNGQNGGPSGSSREAPPLSIGHRLGSGCLVH